MKKIMMMLVAISAFAFSAAFAQSSDCPDDAKPCKKEVREKHHPRKNKREARRPRFNISPEAKAEMQKFRAAVEAYKKDKSDANKAALKELVGKNFDKRLDRELKRAEALKKAAADIEKKTAEAKANRDSEIEKIIERISNPPKRNFKNRAKRPAPAKPAPAAEAAK